MTRSLEQQFYVEDLDNVVIDMENLLEIYEVIFSKLDTLKYLFEDIVESRFFE